MSFTTLPAWTRAALISVAVVVASPLPGSAVEPLSDAEIAKFRSQFEQGSAIQVKLNTTVACFVEQDAELQERSNSLELESGTLRQTSDRLRSEYISTKSQVDDFNKQVNEINRKIQDTQNEIDRNYSRLRQAERDLETCKKAARSAAGGPFRWIFGSNPITDPLADAGCDFAGEIAGWNSKISNARAHMDALSVQVRSRRKQLDATQKRLTQASNDFQSAEQAVQANKARITDVDHQISAIKTSLSEVRNERQDYAASLNTFTGALSEYQDLDPNSDRRPVINQLRDASEEMDEALSDANAVLARGGLTLPNGATICAL